MRAEFLIWQYALLALFKLLIGRNSKIPSTKNSLCENLYFIQKYSVNRYWIQQPSNVHSSIAYPLCLNENSNMTIMCTIEPLKPFHMLETYLETKYKHHTFLESRMFKG